MTLHSPVYKNMKFKRIIWFSFTNLATKKTTYAGSSLITVYMRTEEAILDK